MLLISNFLSQLLKNCFLFYFFFHLKSLRRNLHCFQHHLHLLQNPPLPQRPATGLAFPKQRHILWAFLPTPTPHTCLHLIPLPLPPPLRFSFHRSCLLPASTNHYVIKYIFTGKPTKTVVKICASLHVVTHTASNIR